jgi:uncharacterized membrane protein
MLAFLAVAISSASIIGLWMRTSRLEQTVDSLSGRLIALERELSEARAAAKPPSPSRAAIPQVETAQPRPVAAPERSLHRPPVLMPRELEAAKPPAAPSTEAIAAESLETAIGSRWLLYVGVVAIVVGVAFFEKLAMDNGWITATARVIQGGVAGLLLLLAGRQLAARGFPLYGQMIEGCGIAILYVVTFAAFNVYHLIGRPLATAMMVAITGTAGWSADRARSQGLAILAVGGGFATPFLLPVQTDTQFALFAYEAVLIAGTMYLARRRDWPALNLVSYALTLLTIVAWTDRFYTSDKYLATELFFTLFLLMYLFIKRQLRRSTLELAAVARAVLWTAPLFHYLASLAILFTHPTALLLYLVGLSLCGVALAARLGAHSPHASVVRFSFLVLTTFPLILRLAAYPNQTGMLAGAMTVAALFLMNLAGHLIAAYIEDRLMDSWDVAALHLNGLAGFAGLYFLVDARNDAWSAPLAALLAICHASLGLAVASKDREQGLHFAGVASSLLMIAVGLQFDGLWLTMGWAVEGVVVAGLGLRFQKMWLRNGGLALFAIAVARTLELQLRDTMLQQMPLLNQRAACGLLIVGLCYVLAWLHQRYSKSEERHLEVATASTPSPLLLPIRMYDVLLFAASLLTLSLVTSEISAYWRLHDAARGLRTISADSVLARGMMVSVAWAAYATALIGAGFRKRYAPIRFLAFVIFGATIVKVFLIDLATLERMYRVLSVVGLGVTLLITSYVYTRYWSRLIGQSDRRA